MDSSAESKQMSENFNSARDLDLIEFVCWASRIGLGGSRSGSAGCKAPSMQPNYGGAQWRLQVVVLQFEAEDQAAALSLSNGFWETMRPFRSNRVELTVRGQERLAEENSW